MAGKNFVPSRVAVLSRVSSYSRPHPRLVFCFATRCPTLHHRPAIWIASEGKDSRSSSFRHTCTAALPVSKSSSTETLSLPTPTCSQQLYKSNVLFTPPYSFISLTIFIKPLLSVKVLPKDRIVIAVALKRCGHTLGTPTLHLIRRRRSVRE